MAEKQRQFDAELAYQKSKSSSSSGGSISKSSGSGGSGGVIAPQAKSNLVTNSAYWNKEINSDVEKYGAFSNGYQPKGISGHGKLTRGSNYVTFETETLHGIKQTVTQKTWVAEDGTEWYWDGRQNKYIRVSNTGGGGGKFR
jgi:hypothetical protein